MGSGASCPVWRRRIRGSCTRELEALKRERTVHESDDELAGDPGDTAEGLRSSFLARLSAARLWDQLAGAGGIAHSFWSASTCVGPGAGADRRAGEASDAQPRARREIVERETARRLYRLRGIGENYAWLASMEAFAWRRFDNRRQVGGMAGLTPTPYSSGSPSSATRELARTATGGCVRQRSRSLGAGCASNLTAS